MGGRVTTHKRAIAVVANETGKKGEENEGQRRKVVMDRDTDQTENYFKLTLLSYFAQFFPLSRDVRGHESESNEGCLPCGPARQQSTGFSPPPFLSFFSFSPLIVVCTIFSSSLLDQRECSSDAIVSVFCVSFLVSSPPSLPLPPFPSPPPLPSFSFVLNIGSMGRAFCLH